MTTAQFNAVVTAAGGIDKVKYWNLTSGKYLAGNRFSATHDTTTEQLILYDKAEGITSYLPLEFLEFVDF